MTPLYFAAFACLCCFIIGFLAGRWSIPQADCPEPEPDVEPFVDYWEPGWDEPVAPADRYYPRSGEGQG